MPVGCPNCGTQNADGSLFCQNCRTPLTGGPVAAAPGAQPGGPVYGPPPGYAQVPPAYAAPAGYAPAYSGGPSPYYAPAGGPAPVHRTPTGLIIGGGIAIFLILAILAVAGAFIFGGRSSGNHVAPTPPPTTAPVPPPTSTPSAAPSANPTPSSKPTTNPSPPPSAGSGGIDTNTFTMGLAPGFKKLKSDNVSALVANDTGNIYVAAGRQDHESSVQNEFTGIVDNLKQKYSQVAPCTKPADFTVDGVAGTIWGFNYLFTPQGGQAVKVCDLFFVAVPDSDKTLVYEVELFMADADFDKFANGSALPEVKTIRWKTIP